MSTLPTEVNAPTADILIVDDTVANLTLLAKILKSCGHKVRPVTNGALAIQAAKTHPPDIILLDIAMPEMDGFEVCRRLKSDNELAAIPILFISAYTETLDKVKAFSEGGADYITKPFQYEEVVARVNAHLQVARQQKTLQQQFEKLKALEKLRDDLVHMVIHDLRSPLSAIVTLLGLIKEESTPLLPQEMLTDLDQCIFASGQMANMISEVLDVSKLETNALPLQHETFDVVPVVEELIRELRGFAASINIFFRPIQTTVPLYADHHLIKRVIQNLLNNAIKFTPEGGSITISVSNEQQSFHFEIADTGPGIPKEYQEKIFEKFAQTDARSHGAQHSSGLGLTFCKMAVVAHQGSIGVKCSEDQKGSLFWFSLPSPATVLERDYPHHPSDPAPISVAS